MSVRSRLKGARALLGFVACFTAIQLVAFSTIGVRVASAQVDCTPPEKLPRNAPKSKMLLQQICVGGVTQPTSYPMTLDRPDQQPHPNPDATVNTGEDDFPSGTVFTAPTTTAYDIVSERSVTHLFPGSQNKKYAASESELNVVLFGKVRFSVSPAKLFRTVSGTLLNPTVGVIAESIYCVSRDTDFTVDVDPKKNVTVAVTDGVVDVTRAISIRLVAEGVVINGIRDFSSVATGQTATFDVSAPPQDYPNSNEAQTYYTAQLQAALARDDRPRIEDITFNLRQIQDVTPGAPPTAPHATHGSAIRNVAAALGTAIILVLPGIVGSHTTPNLQQPVRVRAPVPGTIGLQGQVPQPPAKPKL